MYYRFTKMDEGRQGSIDFSRTDFPFPVLFPFLSSFLFVFCNRSHRWITNERTKRSTKILNLNKSFLVNSSFFLYLVAGLRPFAKHWHKIIKTASVLVPESKASFSISRTEKAERNHNRCVLFFFFLLFFDLLSLPRISILLYRYISDSFLFFFPSLFLLSLFFSFFFFNQIRKIEELFFSEYSIRKIDQRWIFHRWHVTTLFLRFFRLLSSYQIPIPIFVLSLLYCCCRLLLVDYVYFFYPLFFIFFKFFLL